METLAVSVLIASILFVIVGIGIYSLGKAANACPEVDFRMVFAAYFGTRTGIFVASVGGIGMFVSGSYLLEKVFQTL